LLFLVPLLQDLRELFPRHLSCAPGYAGGDTGDEQAAAEARAKEGEEEGGAGAAGSMCRENKEALRLWRCGKGVYESIQNVVQVPPAR